MNTEKSKILNELEALKGKAQALITERLGDNFVLEHSIPCIWKTRCWKIRPLVVAGDEYGVGSATFSCIIRFRFYVKYMHVMNDDVAIKNSLDALKTLIKNLKTVNEKKAHEFDVKFRRAVTAYKCRN